ncbi:U3 small nucleolar RNA-associated protein 24 [Angomonas deanei]|nr:U3 small nucleolar RNA-associated protein 24 [Angomonas deanei]|eukprot:EPY26398.1 U3 small nucleolar RNA-associated protein 24 [Angomonas deanei]
MPSKNINERKKLSPEKKREAESFHAAGVKTRGGEEAHDDSELTTAQAKKDFAARQFRKLMLTEQNNLHNNLLNSSHSFLSYNHNLGPPYRILLDTNFINFSLQNKMDIYQSLMDCMLAKVIPCICDCVIAELEKLGKKFSLALKMILKEQAEHTNNNELNQNNNNESGKRFQRLHCENKYADDCIVRRVSQTPIYIVATCDQELKRRLRKLPGVPILYIAKHRYTIERLPEVFGAPA